MDQSHRSRSCRENITIFRKKEEKGLITSYPAPPGGHAGLVFLEKSEKNMHAGNVMMLQYRTELKEGKSRLKIEMSRGLATEGT